MNDLDRITQEDIANGRFSRSLGALKSRDGNDWELADAIAAEVPLGRRGYSSGGGDGLERLVRVLQTEGIDIAPATLRAYRDVAAKWQPSERVEKVSFSAHRAATPKVAKNPHARWGQPRWDATPARKLLEQLKERKGVVSVADVKTIVAGSKTKKRHAERESLFRKLASAIDDASDDDGFAEWAVKDPTRRVKIEAMLSPMSHVWDDLGTAMSETPAANRVSTPKTDGEPDTLAGRDAAAGAAPKSGKTKGGNVATTPVRRGRRRG